MKNSELIEANKTLISNMIAAGAGYGDIAKAVKCKKKNSMFNLSLKKAGFDCKCVEYAREKVEITDIVEPGSSYEEALTKHFGHDRFGAPWIDGDSEFVYVYKF